MSSVLFSVIPAKLTLEQVYDRIRELGNQKCKQTNSEFLSSQLGDGNIKQCVIGPKYIAFLLEDGRVCRVPFIVNTDKFDFTSKDPGDEECISAPPRSVANVLVHSTSRSPRSELSVPFTISGEALNTLSGQLGRWGTPRTGAGNSTTAATSRATTSTAGSSSSQTTAGIRVRGRMLRAAMRGRSGTGWIGSRAMIPASAVPDELVAQVRFKDNLRSISTAVADIARAVNKDIARAVDMKNNGRNAKLKAQVVLQGKSRHTIIRELQRTNLDVNLAVNNLLSRDDDDPDDQDEGADSYIPGDELISIFEGEDNSFIVDPDTIFPEDILYSSSVNRPSSRAANRPSNNEGTNRGDSSDRYRDISGAVRQYEKYWDVMNLEPGSSKSGKMKANQKAKVSSDDFHILGGELEFWKVKQCDQDSMPLKFIHIAALHSELIALSVDGKLHQWLWNDAFPVPAQPGQHSHRRASDMKLKDEKVVMLDACNVRASILTESGKVATWLDDTLTAVAYKLEHPAQAFAEFRNQPVTALHVCDLYSCVQLVNGSLMWWGVFPFEQRRKLMDKVKQKAKKSAISGSSLIQAGTQVCLRSCPLYYPGAIGFTAVNGEPKVGELLEQAWTITEKCRFKLLKHGEKISENSQGDDCNNEEYEQPTDSSNKRKRSVSYEESESKAIEEQWNLKDTIFVEDIRNVPVGKVLKVDGAYALVNFSDKEGSSAEVASNDLAAMLKNCRLVRKDELQIVKWSTPPKMSECFQKTPKHLSVPGNSKVVTMALDTNGVHALLKSPSGTKYATFSLASGRIEPGGSIPFECSLFLGSSSVPANPVMYTTGVESIVLLRDGNGCIFPLVKDCVGGIRNPNWVVSISFSESAVSDNVKLFVKGILCLVNGVTSRANLGLVHCGTVNGYCTYSGQWRNELDAPETEINLPPVISLGVGTQCFSNGPTKSHAIVAVFVCKDQWLMTSVASSDIEGLRQNLAIISKDKDLAATALAEKCDGNRNILHKAVSMCFPVTTKAKHNSSTKQSDKDAQANLAKSLDLTQRTSSRDLDDVGIIGIPIPTRSWPPEIGQHQSDDTEDASRWIPVGDKSDCSICFKEVLNSRIVQPHLVRLLKERDATGCTPFMSAVRGRAYEAAIELMDIAQREAGGKDGKVDQDLFASMIYPAGVDADLSPFYMVCCNDTCSFTWTGTTHINQDIFECRTCGLVGTLCCCTECARVCHVGHDCKLKRTSPTAYCDCWEKCACKALIPGEQKLRLDLLKKLITETNLATKPNKDGEHVLLFLAKTVARQNSEQGQYTTTKSNDTKARNSNTRGIGTPPLPAHDLEPPKFAKLALEHILKDWKALESMLISGSGDEKANIRLPSVDDHFANMIGSSILSTDEQMTYLKSQQGTARLDTFVHCLLVKCSAEYLEILLRTLENTLADAKEKNDCRPLHAAKRFVRSVCRIFVVLSSSLGVTTTKRKGNASFSLPLSKCRRVFSSLNVLAAKELGQIADSIFAPVRLGVVYPSAPFTLSSVSSDGPQACEELFSVLPFPSRTSHSANARGHHVRFEESQTEQSAESTDQEHPVDAEMDESTQDDHGLELAMPLESQEELNIDNEESQNAESDMDLDLLAESESDSDDSNVEDVVDNQRSGSGNTNGRQTRSPDIADGNRNHHDADTVDYYSGNESINDVDDEDAEIEEEEDDFADTQLSEPALQRLIRGMQRGETHRAPHALQWAVRNQRRETASEATAHVYVSAGNNSIRRNAAGASAAADIHASGNTLYCMPSALARTFGLVIKELSDVLTLSNDSSTVAIYCIPPDQESLNEARLLVDSVLDGTWKWLWKVMETTEAQLRFGASLTAVSDPSHPNHPLHDFQLKKTDGARGTSSILSVARNWNPDTKRKRRGLGGNDATDSSLRQDFLTYLLSLMRGSENEHGDSLPTLEMSSLRHVAYILDAFVYYLRSKNKKKEASEDATVGVVDQTKNSAEPCSSKTIVENSEDGYDSELEDEVVEGKETSSSRRKFFKRTDSTLVLGFEPSDPFKSTVKEALPLADKPHLLNPSARRDQLFGSTKSVGGEPHLDMPHYIGFGLRNKVDEDGPSQTLSGAARIPETGSVSANFVLGRWRMCLELFCRLFLDDVGAEPHSVLNELGRFDVKEAKFRREMEKLRNNHQKDLYIEEVERDRVPMIRQTFRKLEAFFGRRGPGPSVPVNVHRLRVSFKDEPGEGTGVVRSFYTAIGEALLSDANLPPLDSIFLASKDESQRGLMLLAGLTQRLKSRARERDRERERERGRRSAGGGAGASSQAGSAGTVTAGATAATMMPSARMRREREHARHVMEREGRQKLNPDAKPYVYDPDVIETSENEDTDDNDPVQKKYLGRRLYSRVYSVQGAQPWASQITGMFLELSTTQIILLLTQEEILKSRVAEAIGLITAKEENNQSGAGSSGLEASGDKSSMEVEEEEDVIDNSPLFFQPGKLGFYSLRPGRYSVERMSCFRNVGRLLGLCLLQNELSPMSFNRHVIKYLLGKQVNWHDLAFLDPTLYESLRQLIQDSQRPDAKEYFESLDLTFCIELSTEEGGTTVEIVKNGKQMPVTHRNVHDYVKRYAEHRMITVAKKPLESLRRGLLDILPAHTLDGLTAEDFRLLLNGSGDINVQQLMSYTSFSDETGGDSQDKLSKFKRWFWSIVHGMTAKQRQDMLYFWTSSPAMPASSEGFQPMPSVTVKPANDHQLPTANTCISRLYIPLYSSKSILKSKLLLAIRTRTFGFV
eukprot:gene11765-12982_t